MIARTVVEGRSKGELAERLGVTRRAIDKIAATPENKALQKRMAERYDRALAEAYGETIESIRRDLSAEFGPDRQAARREVLDLIERADKARGFAVAEGPAVGAGTGQWTLSELLVSFHEARAVKVVEDSGAAPRS